MNKVLDFLKEHKYLMVALVLVGISITLGVTYSNYFVTSNNHKAAEMYIGELKYSMEIDGSTTNTLSVPTGETIIDVKVNNLNPVDTYYKLLYLKNSNLTVKYYETTKDTDEVVTTYSKPNDSIAGSNSNNIKLLITNNSTSSQNVAFTMKGGYITNTIQDITTPSAYSEITLVETPSTNTYFCKTNDTLTDGYTYTDSGYTYKYKWQVNPNSSLGWDVLNYDGFGVQQTDRTSTSAFSGKMCTYINDKPILSMVYTFYNSNSTSLDLSNANTSNVIDMSNMFNGAKVTSLDLSGFDTNNVGNMSGMFKNISVSTLNISSFKTSLVTDMSEMFSSCKTSNLIGLENITFNAVSTTSKMFYNSTVERIDFSDLISLNNIDMSYMFSGISADSVSIAGMSLNNVITMEKMFYQANITELIDMNNAYAYSLTNISDIFSECTTSTIDMGNLNIGLVVDLSNLFANSTVKNINMNSMISDSATSVSDMFSINTIEKVDMSNSSFNALKSTEKCLRMQLLII